MPSFRLRGSIIIKLIATYSLITGITGLYGSITTFIPIAGIHAPTEQLILIFAFLFSLLFLVHALALFRAWPGAWLSTIIFYGIFCVFVLLNGLNHGFDDFDLGTLGRLIIYCTIVAIFLINKQVRATLSRVKDLNSPGAISLKQKRLAELAELPNNTDLQDTPPDTSAT